MPLTIALWLALFAPQATTPAPSPSTPASHPSYPPPVAPATSFLFPAPEIKPCGPNKFGLYTGTIGLKSPTVTRLLGSVPPSQDKKARKSKATGTAVVAFIVSADGVPLNVHVVSSSATTLGKKHQDLAPGVDQQAVESAAKLRFSPATCKGIPVPTEMFVAVAFQVSADPATAPQTPRSSTP